MAKQGFTLVELLVVIAIIGLLSLAVLVNYRFGQKQFILQQAANQLAQDLRLAENRAISTAISTKELEEGYVVHGIKFEKGQETYQFISCSLSNINTCNEQDDQVSLPAKVKILEFLPEGENILIKFIPPDPKVVFQTENEEIEEITESEVQIVLSHKETSSEITVSVNKAGLIQIEK
ncbi:MAG: pilus assembly FimT family protein [Minisyncoccales bacterium]